MNTFKPTIGKALPEPQPTSEADILTNLPPVGTPVRAKHRNGSVINGYFAGQKPQYINIFCIRLGKDQYLSEKIIVTLDQWKIELNPDRSAK